MNRLPNPPKSPVISAAETRAKVAAKARGTVSLCWALAMLSCTVAASVGASAADTTDACQLAAACPAGSCPAASEVLDGNIVVIGTDPARAQRIREHAETMRSQAFVSLLGTSAPPRWFVRCEIHVHATADAFADAVGGPPVDARGATALDFAGDRVVSRRIDVMGDGPCEIPDALDHEMVHVVLADHFAHAPPPRWADEGLAILFDDPDRQRDHDAEFQAASRRGLSWTAEELVSLEEYPTDGGRQRVFYGQSAALVRWLVARRDAATFVRFLDAATTDGIEPALRRHYDLDSLASVTSAWKEVAPINSLGRADLRRERLP